MKKLNLVDAETLLEILFDERSRPTIRWVRDQQKRRTISWVKIGHLVRFDVDRVRKELDSRNRIRAKRCI